MTNGEKICNGKRSNYSYFDEWWNAEYQKLLPKENPLPEKCRDCMFKTTCGGKR